MNLNQWGVSPLLQVIAGIFGLLTVAGVSTWIEWQHPARKPRGSFWHVYFGPDFAVFWTVMVYLCIIQWGQDVFKSWFPVEPVRWQSPVVGAAVAFFLVFIVLDFLVYWTHRLMHTAQVWRTHRWHHSITEVNWLSGVRGSFIEFVLYSVPSFALFLWFPETLPWALVLALYSQFFVHLNIKVGKRYPSHWLVTPHFHRVHHALDTKLHNKNFGTFLVVWDRWFGTLAEDKGVGEKFELGLGKEHVDWRTGVGF